MFYLSRTSILSQKKFGARFLNLQYCKTSVYNPTVLHPIELNHGVSELLHPNCISYIYGKGVTHIVLK